MFHLTKRVPTLKSWLLHPVLDSTNLLVKEATLVKTRQDLSFLKL